MDGNSDLVFAAGRIAERLAWSDVVPATVADLKAATASPSGPPILLVTEASAVTLEVMKVFAALSVHREVALVCDRPLPDDLAAWAPSGSVHLASDVAPPPQPMDAFVWWTPWDELQVDWERGPFDEGLADMLDSVIVAPNLGVEWWMAGNVLVHSGGPKAGSGGWDGSSDLVGDLEAMLAVPLFVGGAAVLGMCAIEGQVAEDGCYVVTGDWATEGDRALADYIDESGQRRLLGVTVSILMGDQYPDPYPPAVALVPRGPEIMGTFLEQVLLSLLQGTLRHGSEGLAAVLPHLTEWITDQRRLAAALLRPRSQP